MLFVCTHVVAFSPGGVQEQGEKEVLKRLYNVIRLNGLLLLNILEDDDDDDDMNNNLRSNGMPPLITADHTSRPIPAEG